MSLTAAEVAEIMRLVEQSTFDELTLEMDGVKLSLRRGAAVQINGAALSSSGSVVGAGGPQSPGGSEARTDAPSRSMTGPGGSSISSDSGGSSGSAGYPAITPSAARAGAASSNAAGTAAIPAQSASGGIPAHKPPGANEHDVISPLLGTFYRSPKPGAPAFVEVGATVEADTVIAIIEVMKLMNTVRAGVRGTVTDIFVADGALVEFEQPLIRVSKTG